MTEETFNESWTPEPFSGCWLWTRTVTDRGYGQIYLRGTKGASYAHRFSWSIYRGAIPQGFHVCHRCDTPSCVNPSHLFLGSRSDNMRDAAAKGRHNGGQKMISTPYRVWRPVRKHTLQ